MVTEQTVREALDAVLDPCSEMNRTNLSITEMGMVREVEVDGDAVRVKLLLTEPTCIYFFEISRQIRETLAGLPGIDSVEVESMSDTLWTPDLMTPHARRRLEERRKRQLTLLTQSRR